MSDLPETFCNRYHASRVFTDSGLHESLPLFDWFMPKSKGLDKKVSGRQSILLQRESSDRKGSQGVRSSHAVFKHVDLLAHSKICRLSKIHTPKQPSARWLYPVPTAAPPEQQHPGAAIINSRWLTTSAMILRAQSTELVVCPWLALTLPTCPNCESP